MSSEEIRKVAKEIISKDEFHVDKGLYIKAIKDLSNIEAIIDSFNDDISSYKEEDKDIEKERKIFLKNSKDIRSIILKALKRLIDLKGNDYFKVRFHNRGY